MAKDNFNKLLNEKYFLLKDIQKKYDYNEELLCMITFIYIAFYMSLGKKSDFVLYDLFDKVKVIYDKGTVGQVSQKYGFGPLPDGAAAVTSFTPNLKVFDNPNLKQIPQVIILGTHVQQYLATDMLKLEMLLHEIRHALMGYYNTNKLLNEKIYYMRSGLQETFYIKKDDFEKNIDVVKKSIILDEVLNTYITQNLTNVIMNFKKLQIDNLELKKYVMRLKVNQKDNIYRPLGYNDMVRLMYPLLQNETFINLVDKHQFDGELDIIKNFLTSNSDYQNYDEFAFYLDKIHQDNNLYNEIAQNQREYDEIFIKNHVQSIQKMKEVILNLKGNIEGKTLKKTL